MKTFFFAAALLAGAATASAQTPNSKAGSGSAAQRASTSNADTPSPTAITTAPNYAPSKGQRGNKKINTAPATGPNRASRSSSTTKAARQGKATGSGNIESMQKNSSAKPGAKK